MRLDHVMNHLKVGAQKKTTAERVRLDKRKIRWQTRFRAEYLLVKGPAAWLRNAFTGSGKGILRAYAYSLGTIFIRDVLLKY